MNRMFRMRRYNSSKKAFDVLYPQAVTENILRQSDGGVLESCLIQYDRHLIDKLVHLNRATSFGDYRHLEVTIRDSVLTDGYPLLLTLHCDLECEPTLVFNGGEEIHIISANGDNIPGGQAEGTVLFLVYSESLNKWILMSCNDTSDVTKVVLPVESEYVYQAEGNGITTFVIPNFNKESDKLTINYGQTILRANIDFTFDERSNNTVILNDMPLQKGDLLYCTITKYITTAKRGTLNYDLVSKDYPVTIEVDNTQVITVPSDAEGAHSVIVNYGQTILRNTLDYDYSEDGKIITLHNIALNAGETLVFTITKFVETTAKIVPNNWGATGNYRYSMNVIHTSYVATENDITVIPVPGFNYKRDDIWVIKDNKLYIYDVDYTIDEIGQVVLLKTSLAKDEEIFFTILQGAMFDVPNFNVIRASGESGQHINLNMSYNVLCNYYVLLIRLIHDLETNPTLKCMDGPAEPICDCFGNPVLAGYKAGSYLWVVYNEDKHCWYSLGHGQLDIMSLLPEQKLTTGESNFLSQPNGIITEYREAVIEHGLGEKPTKIDIQPTEPPNILPDGSMSRIGDVWFYADEKYLYVGNTGKATSKFKWTVSAESATADLKQYIDQQIQEVRNSPGKFETKLVAYTADADGITLIEPIDGYTANVDKLIVNYGQTLLREGVDYTITDNHGIQLLNIELSMGDIIQFTIIVQEPVIP